MDQIILLTMLVTIGIVIWIIFGSFDCLKEREKKLTLYQTTRDELAKISTDDASCKTSLAQLNKAIETMKGELFKKTDNSFQECKKSVESSITEFENILKLSGGIPMTRQEIKRKYGIPW